MTIVAAVGGAGFGQSPDARYVEGLRQRRLFTLAESFCERELEKPDLSTTQRGELTIGLMRCYVEHARGLLPTRREDVWQKAHSAARLDSWKTDDPIRLLIRFQDALIYLSRGELIRQEIEVGVANALPMNVAKQCLTTAAARFESVRNDAMAMRRRSSSASPTGTFLLSDNRLLALSQNAIQQNAIAWRNLAQCFPADSDDRTNALIQATGYLTELLATRPDGRRQARWQMDLARCYRLWGRLDMCERTLTRIDHENLGLRLGGDWKAEMVKLAIARQDPTSGLGFVSDRSLAEHAESRELRFARVELFIALWLTAQNQASRADAKKWQENAAAAVDDVQRTCGPYWTRRAEFLFANAALRGTGSSDLDALLRSARNLYARNQIDEALPIYDRCFERAKGLGYAVRAFDIAFEAATIQHERKEHGDAIRRFRDLAMANVAHRRAAESHLLAILNASLRARNKQASDLDQYVTLLDEHLRTWPNHATSDQVRWWRSRLYVRDKKWQRAAKILEAISSRFHQYDTVVRELGRCYDHWFDTLDLSKSSARQVVRSAKETLRRIAVDGSRNGSPRGQDDPARRALLLAAELSVRYFPEDSSAVIDELENQFIAVEDAPNARRAHAASLLVVGWAARNDWPRARSYLTRLGDLSAEELAQRTHDLARLENASLALNQRELGELVLQMLELLLNKRLTPNQEQDGRRLRAKALVLAGRSDEARRIYERLLKQSPNDGALYETYALLLSEKDDRSSLVHALEIWRLVARKSLPRSDRWFGAKFHIARIHVQLGDKEKARQVIELTRALYPDLGNPALKRQFLDLLETIH